ALGTVPRPGRLLAAAGGASEHRLPDGRPERWGDVRRLRRQGPGAGSIRLGPAGRDPPLPAAGGLAAPALRRLRLGSAADAHGTRLARSGGRVASGGHSLGAGAPTGSGVSGGVGLPDAGTVLRHRADRGPGRRATDVLAADGTGGSRGGGRP